MQIALTEPALQLPWLERDAAAGEDRRLTLADLPCTVGRSDPADVVLDSPRVSRVHAAFVRVDGRVCVEDRGSTNGTFVNGERVRSQSLEDGDSIRFADLEFTFRAPRQQETVRATQVMGGGSGNGRRGVDLVQEARRATERLTHCGLRLSFEQIAALSDGKTFGWRLKDDDGLAGARSLPAECRAAARLRQMQRLLAVEAAAQWRDSMHLFLPLDALEIGGEELLPSLESLLSVLSEQHRLVVEIADGVVCDTPTFRSFREGLAKLRIGLAHDGFAGTAAQLKGQRSLAPNFLVLCHRMVQGVSSSDSRRKRLREVVEAAGELGCQTIAAGIESADEQTACRTLGVRYARGPAVVEAKS
jgi:EAL domain-containing protein (putative c-di-GMP-specific phosphodiesterase class I)